MFDNRKLEALNALLDPAVVAAWLDEIDSHRRIRSTSAKVSPRVQTPESDRLLDVKEVCERLQVKPSWVYEKTRQGSIPHVRVGTYVRFRWADVERWLDESQS